MWAWEVSADRMSCYKSVCNLIFCHWSSQSDRLVTAAMPGRQLSQPEAARALGMLKASFSPRREAQWMGASHSVICRANWWHQETGLHSERPRRVQLATINPRNACYWKKICLRNCFHKALTSVITLLLILKWLFPLKHSATGFIELLCMLKGQHSAPHFLLLTNHKDSRLNWARRRVGWTRQQLSQVLFTDESLF